MTEHVLVTGGAGYIGSHTCKALSAAGYVPVAYDNLAYGHEWAVKWGPLEKGDITDHRRLTEVFTQYSPTAVIHFAAYAYVGESVVAPAKYYRNNVFGTLTLLDAMREAKIQRLVFSSSCATYGVPEVIPIPEHAPQQPINPYGASKLMCERIIADYCSAYGLRGVGLRYFNAAGADANGDLGEEHDPETHLIPLVLVAAARTRETITIFGTDYDTPDGTCIRDYIHVADLATAHVAALKVPNSSGWHAYNLGTGKGTSVRELISAAERVTGRPISVTLGSRRHGDPPVLVADPRQAEEQLSWRPTQSDIESILQTAWKWIVEGGNHPATKPDSAPCVG